MVVAVEDLLERLLRLDPDRRGAAAVDLVAAALRALGRRRHAVERGDHVEDGDVVGRARQRVAAGGAPAAAHDAAAAERREDLLQELERHVAAVGDVAQAHRLAGLRLLARGRAR